VASTDGLSYSRVSLGRTAHPRRRPPDVKSTQTQGTMLLLPAWAVPSLVFRNQRT